MNHPEPSITVNVDVTNPGQFFACCGLLELADRLWPGAEGWFATEDGHFLINTKHNSPATMAELIHKIKTCNIAGLTETEKREREHLESKKRRLKKSGRQISDELEQRRKDLGTKARSGSLILEHPFSMTLDWWQVDDDKNTAPKTWAGKQELHRIARATQDAVPDTQPFDDLLDFSAVLRLTTDYQKNKVDSNKSVEPFFFDARRFAHALDTGFSLDVQDAETTAHPAVELLALIGLQRHRPQAISKRKFRYGLWTNPLSTLVTPTITCNALTGTVLHEFQLLSRDNEDRYKSFNFATPLEINHEQ